MGGQSTRVSCCTFEGGINSVSNRDPKLKFYTCVERKTCGGRELLAASRIIMSDGTFKISPLFLMQLYTIHGSFHGKFLPLVFVLLSHKDEQSYAAMLAKIRELCPGMEPGIILTDFKKGALNVYNRVG